MLWRSWEWDSVATAGMFLATWGLGRLFQERSRNLAHLGALVGRIAAGLFLVLAMIGAVALPRPARVYLEQPDTAGGAFHAVQAIFWSTGRAAMCAAGWWILFSSLAGRRTRQLPRGLCWLGIAAGIPYILMLIVPGLDAVALTVGMVWLTWLGIVLMRAGYQPVPAGGTARLATDPERQR